MLRITPHLKHAVVEKNVVAMTSFWSLRLVCVCFFLNQDGVMGFEIIGAASWLDHFDLGWNSLTVIKP